ncbi:MAG: hypothetical protein ACXW2T_00390 [Allosphingosinicella sp.]
MIRPALAIALLALASGFSGAGAQTLDELITPGDPTRLAAAFKAICLDPGPNPEARIAAATAAPWNFTPKGATKKLGSIYGAWPLQLVISRRGPVPSCVMTSSLPSETDIAAIAAIAETAFGARDGRIDAARRSIRWRNMGDEVTQVSFAIRDGAGIKVGSFIVTTAKVE